MEHVDVHEAFGRSVVPSLFFSFDLLIHKSRFIQLLDQRRETLIDSFLREYRNLFQSTVVYHLNNILKMRQVIRGHMSFLGKVTNGLGH